MLRSMSSAAICRRACARVLLAATLTAVFAFPVAAQTCFTGADMAAAEKSSVEAAAARYFQYAATGDYANLRQNSIPAVVSSFDNIVSVIGDNKPNLAGQASIRGAYVLDAPASANLQHAQFFCGVLGMQDSVAFSLNNLPPGRYAVVIQDVRGGKAPLTFTEILQQSGSAWELAGLYLKPGQVAGRDGDWYVNQARAYKQKGQTRNAWFYYLTAWEIQQPANFVSTPQLDKLGEEMQATKPADLPAQNAPQDLLAGGKTYKLTTMFPAPAGDKLDLVVKYQVPSLGDSTESFRDNSAVISALVNKYPELREAFSDVVARATAPNGQDYGTALAMKDVK